MINRTYYLDSFGIFVISFIKVTCFYVFKTVWGVPDANHAELWRALKCSGELWYARAPWERLLRRLLGKALGKESRRPFFGSVFHSQNRCASTNPIPGVFPALYKSMIRALLCQALTILTYGLRCVSTDGMQWLGPNAGDI